MNKNQVKKVLTDKFNKTKSTAAVKKVVEEEMTGDVQSIGYDVYNEYFMGAAERIALASNLYHTIAYIPEHERAKIAANDFAGPGRTFPINSQEHLNSAVHLVGHAANPSSVKRKIIEIAKRKGLSLPDGWE